MVVTGLFENPLILSQAMSNVAGDVVLWVERHRRGDFPYGGTALRDEVAIIPAVVRTAHPRLAGNLRETSGGYRGRAALVLDRAGARDDNVGVHDLAVVELAPRLEDQDVLRPLQSQELEDLRPPLVDDVVGHDDEGGLCVQHSLPAPFSALVHGRLDALGLALVV